MSHHEFQQQEAKRDPDTGQILEESPAINMQILISGHESMLALREQDDPASQVVSDIYFDLFHQKNPDTGPHDYVTYAEVAGELNRQLGTEWITEADIYKLSRTTDYEENVYKIENAIYARRFLDQAFDLDMPPEDRTMPVSILARIAKEPELFMGGTDNHESSQARNIARLTMFYRGNPRLRKFAFERTGELLRSRANNRDLRSDSRKIYRGHYESIGGDVENLDSPYVFVPETTYLPSKLVSSKKLLNEITTNALEHAACDEEIMSTISELDIIVATGFLHGQNREEISRRIDAFIVDGVSNIEPTVDKVDENDIKVLNVQPYTIGRWFSWLSGARMKQNSKR